MPEIPTKEELLAANSHVSRDELDKAIEMLQKLRESGTFASGYRLSPTGSSRRVSVGSDNEKTVQLRRSLR